MRAGRRGRSYDAVIFDMDGVLLDTEPQYMRAMQMAARRFGFEIEDTLLLGLIGSSGAESRRRLSAALGAEFPMDEFSDVWPALWQELVTSEGIARKPGVEDILAFVEEQELAHAIATSSNGHHARKSLSAAGLLESFDVRVTGDQVVNGKPAPDIYLEAARRLGVDASRCFAFEDSAPGLAAALGAGMTAFLIPDLNPASSRCRETAHGVLNSLNEALPLLLELLDARSRSTRD